MKVHVWAPAFTGFGGGITAFSRELANALRELGHELRLIGKLDTPGMWQGLPLRGAGGSFTPLRTARFAVEALVSCAAHGPDHLISTHVNFGPAAHWARLAFGTPYTVVAHGIDVHARLSRVQRAALRASCQILAVSQWTRQRLLDLGDIDPAHIAVLPNTVDEQRFSIDAAPEYLARRYALKASEKVVLTVARLERGEGYKGYDRVVRALPVVRAACGDVRFIVVGKGDDRARIEDLARSQGVGEAVTFAGFVSEEELADHYRLADVFAMPSTGEGFGIVFLEAMACGTPVLAGNRDGSVDALAGGRLGRLVDPTEVDAIACGLISLLRREGPEWWFDKHALRAAVIDRFGRAAFRNTVRHLFSGPTSKGTNRPCVE